ncbi:Hypothetical predicted protein [Podarcis lilfordi]|uniref:Uncharacterized protein n=1 Tax=Podarcis lilfordi TaxID=74358 RepID=A0AA35KQM9_9SAUR|nr:Hypothetical predicted protein [Podarcis lilfordi]
MIARSSFPGALVADRPWLGHKSLSEANLGASCRVLLVCGSWQRGKEPQASDWQRVHSQAPKTRLLMNSLYQLGFSGEYPSSRLWIRKTELH